LTVKSLVSLHMQRSFCSSDHSVFVEGITLASSKWPSSCK